MEQKIRRDRNMGDNLRKLRLEKKISQESGVLNILASVLIELRKIYNCSYDDFFEGLEKSTD